MKIYAASLVVIQNGEIDHHLFCFSLQPQAETTPEQNAAEIAKNLLPKEGEFQHRLLVQDVDVQAHFAQYVNQEFQSKET